jgi:hypothetical protein
MSDFGDFAFIGKDVLGIIVKLIPKGSKCNFICINSKIMNFVLERVYQPWIPVKNYLTVSHCNNKSSVLKLIEETNASGLGLLFAIKHCNYDYFVKWRRKTFKSSWQNGIIYYYVLRVASMYVKNDDNHIKLLELLVKDKEFKIEKKYFDWYNGYVIKNELYMEWLCKTGQFKYIYGDSCIHKSSVNIIKIHLKYFKFYDYKEYSFLHSGNIDVFKFLLENNYFKLRYKHILKLCGYHQWEEAYKLAGNKYLHLLERIKDKDLISINDVLRDDILNELVE